MGRQYVDTALRRIGELSTEIDPLRTQLASFAKHQAGCRALRLVHQEPDWTADSVSTLPFLWITNPLRLTSCSVAWMPTMWSKSVPSFGRKDKSKHVLARH